MPKGLHWKDQEIGLTRGGNPFYLYPDARSTHMHVIGASGTGKTKLLERMIRRDIANGEGVLLIDPHGSLYSDLVKWMTDIDAGRFRKIALFNPSAQGWAIGFNPLDFSHREQQDLSYCVGAMSHACAQVWGGEDTNVTPLLEQCLYSVLYALAERKLTLAEAYMLLTPEGTGQFLRKYVARTIKDPVMRAQWENFSALRTKDFVEQFGSTNHRLFRFLRDTVVRDIVGQQRAVINFRTMMDEGWVVLVNLNEGGRLTGASAQLLGTLILHHLFLDAMSRPLNPKPSPFYVYIDECHRYLTDDVARILDEGRKFGVHLILAHQHLSQLRKAGETVYGAVMTDARTKAVFGGIDPDDCEVLERMIYPYKDYEEPKKSLYHPAVVQHARAYFRTSSSSSGGANATTESSTTSSGKSVTALPDDPEEVLRVVTQEGNTTSFGSSDTSSWNETSGMTEGIIPEIEWLPGAVHSLDEQIRKAVAYLHTQPARRFVLKPSTRLHSVSLTTYDVKPASIGEGLAARFAERQYERCGFVSRDAMARQEQEERQRQFIQEAQLFFQRARAGTAGESESAERIDPTDDELFQ